MATWNPCAKTVKPDQAYEVWRVDDHPEYGGEWTWYVLKKYQTPEKEAANSYARWHCMVTSPNTSVRGDWGGVYVTDITSIAYKLVLGLSCAYHLAGRGGDQASQSPPLELLRQSQERSNYSVKFLGTPWLSFA